MDFENMKVVRQTEIADQIFELVLSGKNVAGMKPGQFLMVRPAREDLLLRRPISIAAYDKEKSECTLIYRASGDGTKAMANLQAGNTADVIGPLGSGFPVEDLMGKEVLLVGGGIGVPPLYELGKELAGKGAKVTFISGFESKKDAFLVDEMSEFGEVYVSTVDGSLGTKGFVTDVTKELSITPKRVYSCGPLAMLKAVQAAYPGSSTYLSLEERMACGIGACYACVCESAKEGIQQFKVCTDGPVFRADEVKL
ncbi:dihydroorotate dehydrogenase, electron transfer subunit [Listeria floridensis FSL S10-1187]|uniref:Dihydroorotate dehydrogenase B (NAD(+)), electron transfer subunit n=1 Tax=Listeria floridensis FSL S10-1187 TaxID=1265817 RepID=A0ABN0RGJ4_9LIST|nr:dihydroorotate dehydrogenase electron transfer subunit [Listeria floridensis]EUJ33026.1 dihydroorotate dehydrogenase, electron transfer subunit [Listeria floridensis FSL S10-1187]